MANGLMAKMTVLLCLLALACGNKDQPDYSKPQGGGVKIEKPAGKGGPRKETPAVCIWDKGTLRKEPVKKGKWLSTMALGEKVVWLNETKVDSADKNRVYHLVKLSDGTEGWASEYVVALKAKPGVAVGVAGIYRRPDMLTLSDKVFEKREVMAILDTKDDWLEVLGNKKQKKGWVPAKSVSTNDADIAVALLAKKALDGKGLDKKIEKLKFILEKDEFANSLFIPDIKKELADLESEKGKGE